MDGFSSSDLKTASQRAPTAPSTTLWSQLIVTDITFALRYLVVIAYACMAGVPNTGKKDYDLILIFSNIMGESS